MLRSIKTVEDQGGDLVVTLTEGNADLPLILSDYHLIVQPNGGFDKPDAAIGTGPYKLTSYQAGVRATFEKNADDWRDDRGFVDSVELIVMNDTTARIAALSSGQVHFINAVEPKTVKLLERAPTRHDPAHRGQGLLLLPRPLRHGAVRQQRPAAGAEVRDRPAGDPRPDPRRLRHARQRLSDQRELRAGARGHRAARLRSGEGGLPLQEVGPFRLAPAAHLRGGLPRRGRRGRALPGKREGRGHQHRGEARARRRLLDQRLERAALLRLLLGRAADAGPALYHLLRLDGRMERHPLQARGLRRADRQGALRARPGQAQGALPGRGGDGARRGRDRSCRCSTTT